MILISGLVQTKTAVCEQHGEYVSRSFRGREWSQCPVCYADSEAQRAAERAQKMREMEKLMAERRFQVAVERSGLPARYVTKTLDTYRTPTTQQAFAKAEVGVFLGRVYDGEPTGLVLIGRPGTGKTHLAAAIVLDALRNGRTACYTTAAAMIGRIKDTWRRDSSESETQAIAALVAVDVLVIDEIGAQFGSEAEKLLLFRVLNDRYAECRPVVLLSNLSQSEFQAFLGERLVDRVREDHGMVIPCNWESNRRVCA